MGDRSEEIQHKSLEYLFPLAKNDNEELHFSVGEVLSCICSGWESECSEEYRIQYLDNPPSKRHTERNDQLLKSIFTQIVQDFLLSERADTRTAASIWLLSLITNSKSHPLIQDNLKEIQKVFFLLMSDVNEIVQEIAVKGLVLVHELGDEQTKKLLVNDLVATVEF